MSSKEQLGITWSLISFEPIYATLPRSKTWESILRRNMSGMLPYSIPFWWTCCAATMFHSFHKYLPSTITATSVHSYLPLPFRFYRGYHSNFIRQIYFINTNNYNNKKPFSPSSKAASFSQIYYSGDTDEGFDYFRYFTDQYIAYYIVFSCLLLT